MKVIKITALNQKAKDVLLKKEKIDRVVKMIYRIMRWNEEIISYDPLVILVSFPKVKRNIELLVSNVYTDLQERFKKSGLIEYTDYTIEIKDSLKVGCKNG